MDGAYPSSKRRKSLPAQQFSFKPQYSYFEHGFTWYANELYIGSPNYGVSIKLVDFCTQETEAYKVIFLEVK